MRTSRHGTGAYKGIYFSFNLNIFKERIKLKIFLLLCIKMKSWLTNYCCLSLMYYIHFEKLYFFLLRASLLNKLVKDVRQYANIKIFKRNNFFFFLFFTVFFYSILYRQKHLPQERVPLKWQLHEFFCLWFFSWISFLQLQSFSLGPFRIFSKIRGDICKSRCTTGINDTGGKSWSRKSRDTVPLKVVLNKIVEFSRIFWAVRIWMSCDGTCDGPRSGKRIWNQSASEWVSQWVTAVWRGENPR